MIPISLEINNFMSHNESSIDFTKFKAALVLGAYDHNLDQSNGAGKSTILESIMWALFEKSRHKKKDGVVKKDKRSCKVVFVFDIDGMTYRIIRKRDKIIGESDVVLEQWDGKAFQNISCDTNTATNNKITEIININHEIFINSVYFKQNDISMFAEATAGRRKDILKSLLKMDKWDAYQKIAKEKARTLYAQLEEKTRGQIQLDAIRSVIQTCVKDISELRLRIKECNLEYNRLSSVLINLKTEYNSTFGARDPKKLKDLQDEFAKAKQCVIALKNKADGGEKIIKDRIQIISFLRQKLGPLENKIILKKGVDITGLQTKLIGARATEDILKNTIHSLEKEVKLGGSCHICKRPLSKKDVENIKDSQKKELEDLKKKYLSVKYDLSNMEKEFKKYDDIVTQANKAELEKSKIELKIADCRRNITSCNSDNERINEEIKKIKSRDFKYEIAQLKKLFNRDAAEKMENEISFMENKIHNIKQKSDKLNIELGSKEQNRDELVRKEKEQQELQKEILELQANYVIYDKLRNYFGKDGIQAIIIENVIEELENYANDILSKICNEPTSISIKTQNQNDNGSWVETFDIEVSVGSRADDFETLSGGEQFRISLALRLALSRILSQRMGGVIKFLLLDEVSSSLDDKGLDMFIDIIKSLSNEVKILVITHDDKLKERFEDIIIVEKDANGSKIVN